MKVYIYSYGDRSVGIERSASGLEFGFEVEEDDRESIRKELRKFFTEFHDNGKTDVIFEDECVDCHRKLVGNTCMSESCPSFNITFRSQEV